jgi:hypothetical protein
VKKTLVAALSGLAATAASGAIAERHPAELPGLRRTGEMTWLSGGKDRGEAQAIERKAKDFPLEVVFVEKTGKRERHLLAEMPVRITDAEGQVVFDGSSAGPYFLARLPKGRYTVSTRWDAFASSRAVKIGETRQRVVFAWAKPAEAPSANG